MPSLIRSADHETIVLSLIAGGTSTFRCRQRSSVPISGCGRAFNIYTFISLASGYYLVMQSYSTHLPSHSQYYSLSFLSSRQIPFSHVRILAFLASYPHSASQCFSLLPESLASRWQSLLILSTSVESAVQLSFSAVRTASQWKKEETSL